MKNPTNLPPGWGEQRVQRVLRHYESLSEDEAVAEDEAAFEDSAQSRDGGPQGTGARGCVH